MQLNILTLKELHKAKLFCKDRTENYGSHVDRQVTQKSLTLIGTIRNEQSFSV